MRSAIPVSFPSSRSLPPVLVFLAVVALLFGCGDTEPSTEPPFESVRQRLENEPTRLLVASDRSGGSIKAERYVGRTWESGKVDLKIETGELVLRAAGHAILIEHFALGIAPIEVPATVVGHRATLVDVRAHLIEPVLASAAWTDDDSEGRVTTRVKLDLSWAIQIDDTIISIGAPTLPPLPLELAIGGDGDLAHAEVRILAAGEVWSWADLVRLVDLAVVVGADG